MLKRKLKKIPMKYLLNLNSSTFGNVVFQPSYIVNDKKLYSIVYCLQRKFMFVQYVMYQHMFFFIYSYLCNNVSKIIKLWIYSPQNINTFMFWYYGKCGCDVSITTHILIYLLLFKILQFGISFFSQKEWLICRMFIIN